MKEQLNRGSIQVLLGIGYVVIALFLCLAAIENPELNDSEQWIWCAFAVVWGPLLLLLLGILGWL